MCQVLVQYVQLDVFVQRNIQICFGGTLMWLLLEHLKKEIIQL